MPENYDDIIRDLEGVVYRLKEKQKPLAPEHEPEIIEEDGHYCNNDRRKYRKYISLLCSSCSGIHASTDTKTYTCTSGPNKGKSWRVLIIQDQLYNQEHDNKEQANENKNSV